MSDRRPPRFPYVAALLCAACVGMAGYLWMRYSYAWEMTAEQLFEEVRQGRFGRLHLRYVSCSDREWLAGGYMVLASRGPFHRNNGVWRPGPTGSPAALLPHEGTAPTPLAPGRTMRASGRVYVLSSNVLLAVGRSRFHGASVAGIVVGAMGVFVFTVALRHWLNQRRALCVEKAEAET